MGEQQPPVFETFADVYGNSFIANKRFVGMQNLFTEKFGTAPDFFARAPGRVNIIGEHIDYCGYAVFPMALEQDIAFAVSTNSDGKYRMENTSPRFGPNETDVKSFQITGNQWYDFLLCGHKAMVDEGKLESPIGMNVLVDGIVPCSAGLSSSSALVCCSALATMYANKISFSKLVMADAAQHCEKYVGLEGGGMDQAISFLAEFGTEKGTSQDVNVKNQAKLIEFKPLRATDVKLPDGVTFVVANSLREMTKSENAGEYYNKRVSECRIAAQILSKKAGKEWKSTRRLVDTQNVLQKTLEEMVSLVQETFHEEPYTREEVCKELEISKEITILQLLKSLRVKNIVWTNPRECLKRYQKTLKYDVPQEKSSYIIVQDAELITECLNPTTAQAKEFKLYHRSKHVYSEANRVWTFKRVCEESPENVSKILGDLMNASQESCARDYECSCDELDELTTICRESGALGSRLTGAGWGGCTVSLVPTENVEEFIEKVKTRYYDNNENRKEKVKEALFATKPGSGAAIIKHL